MPMAAQNEFILNPYLVWQREQAIPIHTGYFVEDLRTVAVGYWKEAQCQWRIYQSIQCRGQRRRRCSAILVEVKRPIRAARCSTSR